MICIPRLNNKKFYVKKISEKNFGVQKQIADYVRFILFFNSYYVDDLLKLAKTYVDIACVIAWIVNIFLLVFASYDNNYELQLLSLLNMFLLSFRLLSAPNDD